MEPSKHQIDAIFITALSLEDSDERKVFLDHACAGDAELRTTVEELLSAATGSETFFGEQSAQFNVTEEDFQAASDGNVFQESSSIDERIGSRIGRYRLEERIGEGGCGSVYLVEQEEPVRRRAAMKIIKSGMDTKSVIARFEAERQALALMDHPNIARVLDAGSTRAGRPFFVMELVEGSRITEFCDENRFNTEQRLALFVEVCHAVQHAHQKGVVHRDIKPSNVLVSTVDGRPVPHVIDFGIAKATQGDLLETNHTLQEQLLGTPAYMSPEQAELGGLDVDTRSDIYSLGVVLYELLTGRTPFSSEESGRSGVEALRRKLLKEEPLRPSVVLNSLGGTELKVLALHHHAKPPQLISEVRGDLDWIVMKALEKERARRYGTANDLAAELLRFLHHEPVLARPPSRRYRFKKLVHRNKGVFASAGAIGLTLVVGLGVSSWLFFKERQAVGIQVLLRREAEQARANESQLLKQSRARERLARAAVLLSQHRIDEADALLAETPFDSVRPSMEAAGVLRSIGERNASYGRWPQAADCFTGLMVANQLEPPEKIANSSDLLLPGPALLESGNVAGYERFRQGVLDRFGGCTNLPSAVDHVIKVCLLTPADASILLQLEPFSRAAEDSLKDPVGDYLAWRAVALGLLEYRRNEYTNALAWGSRGLKYRDANIACRATIHCMMAMASQRLGRTDEARSDLMRARKLAQDSFVRPGDLGNARQGYWYDWVVVRLLLSEADDLMKTPPDMENDPPADSFQ